ncbi:MAG: 50S ribosomal protein L10 [Candidatus Altiarchaeota archaeon]
MVATWKKKTVENLAKEVGSAKTVAIVSTTGIPSRQFQQIRRKLKAEAKMVMVKNNIIKLVLEKAKIQNLAEYIKGPSALITTSLDPFKLSKLIHSCRRKAPAKAGSISPCDIIVPKGDTPFPAGPVIGDIQKAGIKAKIQSGKIIVTEDSLVVKKGGVVPAEAAGIIARLGIMPVEIGLGLNAAYEGGMVYAGDVLRIDEATTKANIVRAYQNAFNLAYNANIYTKETAKPFIQKAHVEALNLAYNANIYTKETIEVYLAKANSQAKALNALIPETPQA